MKITDPYSPTARANAIVNPVASSTDAAPIGWAVSRGRTPYEAAVSAMEARAEAIAKGEAGELIWLVEHDPLYTAGVSAKETDLLGDALPVFRTGRGGQFTYHGPGQRVVYVMLDLRRRGRDVSCFVRDLERWVIAALGRFNVEGAVRAGRIDYEASGRLIRFFEDGLHGYTYLEGKG